MVPFKLLFLLLLHFESYGFNDWSYNCTVVPNLLPSEHNKFHRKVTSWTQTSFIAKMTSSTWTLSWFYVSFWWLFFLFHFLFLPQGRWTDRSTNYSMHWKCINFRIISIGEVQVHGVIRTLQIWTCKIFKVWMQQSHSKDDKQWTLSWFCVSFIGSSFVSFLVPSSREMNGYKALKYIKNH